MEFIREFSKLGKNDVAIAGGKGASLGEMTQAKIPVPEGYVILSEAFERFLEETDLNVEIDSILHTVKHQEIHTVDRASEQIKALILDAKMPKDIANEINKNFKQLGAKFVAVRSSATAEDSSAAAWAGQLDSYLNTTESSLLDKVKHCWASLFTPRAIFYRFEKGLHETKISVAVVVQKMVNSEVSGIAFSVHPVTQDYNQLIIEAGFGLGEAIVSGTITPDSYVIEKQPRRIIDKNVNNQTKGLYRKKEGGNEWKEPKNGNTQKLNDQEVLELTELVLNIERHYGFPCDIEWAREKDKFYITQSRPITTLTEKKENKPSQIKLQKYVTREHSLFFWMMWNLDAIEYTKPWVGYDLKYVLFKSEGPANKMSTWYDHDELDPYTNNVAENFRKHPAFFERNKKEYLKYWEKLFPYISKKRKIKNIQELKEYFSNLLYWWGPMANLFMLQEKKDIPKHIFDEAQKLRERTQEYSDMEDEVYIAFMKENYPQYSDVAMVLLPEEVFQLDKKQLSNDQLKIIRKRLEGYFIFGKEIYSLNELDTFLQKSNMVLSEETFDSLNELKGMSSYNGQVKGKVRIILNKAQFNQFKAGEILVTEMTSPDFVPILKKASGIITDEGGIMCHAAIISRELKIPCVVGTKVATQVLKDGDEVEVNADNGTVTLFNQTPSFEKIFARDFCMPALEIATISESRNDKPWMPNSKQYKPYILIQRADGTCYVWYNKEGVAQTNKILAERAKKDPSFLKEVENKVRNGIKFIKPLYEKQQALDRNNLLKFIDKFLTAYPWIEAMWWIKSMDSKELGIDNSNLVKLREETETLSAGTEIVIRKSLEKLYPNLELSSSMITLKELRNNKIPSKDILQKRLQEFSLVDSKLILDGLQNISKKEGYILESENIDKNILEIKGQIAYKGKIRGIVCKVMGHIDFGKIKQGQVLVSPMTMVDFLPEMKKASAFITDEGGVTCHAAIVSRELKKPCITGTKIATQVLNDGDEVEIDADKGIIRIISKV